MRGAAAFIAGACRGGRWIDLEESDEKISQQKGKLANLDKHNGNPPSK